MTDVQLRFLLSTSILHLKLASDIGRKSHPGGLYTWLIKRAFVSHVLMNQRQANAPSTAVVDPRYLRHHHSETELLVSPGRERTVFFNAMNENLYRKREYLSAAFMKGGRQRLE